MAITVDFPTQPIRPAVPPSALRLLTEAEQGLADAEHQTDPGRRFAAAYLCALRAESATGANPDADVPNCPGLKLGETVRHVGSLYRMVLAWVRAGDRPTAWQREPDDGQSVEDYFLAGLRAVTAHLSAHDPAE